MKIEIKILTPLRLTKLFIAASRWLLKYADVLNDLNVYPVPDGDTGNKYVYDITICRKCFNRFTN